MRQGNLIVVLLFFLLPAAYAQGFSAFSIKDGLSNNTINCITKDDRGFLWIGTREGLNRFDGQHFISFFSNRTDPATLSGNFIYGLLCFKPGYLLVATDNGLSVLNTISNTFETKKTFPPGLQRGSGINVRSLFMDKQANHIYINYSGETDVFDINLNFLYRLTDLPWAKTLKGMVMNTASWMKDRENRIWIPSDNYGIMLLDEKNQQVYSYQNNPMHFPFLKEYPIRSFFFDEEKQYICYSVWGNGLEKYDFKTGKFQNQYFDIPYGTEARCINSITQNNGSLVCFGSQNIYMVDEETLQFKYLTNKLDFMSSHTVFKDDENTWIGTETKGLLQWPSNASAIQQLKLPFPVHDFTSSAFGICRSANGLIYMAYGLDGLLEVNEEKDIVNQYKLPALNGRVQTVWRVCEDGKNRLWIGAEFGIYEFDKSTKQFKRPGWLPSFTNKLNVSYMFRESKGNICLSFAEPNSIGYYDVWKEQFLYFKNYIVDGKPVYDDRYTIIRMAEENNGNIWMLSLQSGGLLCYNAAQNQWKSFANQKNFTSLAKKVITGICVTGHIIWLSNEYGGGLIRYDYTNDSLRYFTRKDGLLSENILSISKNEAGQLFLVTKSGINYLNPKTFDISSLSVNEENIDWAFANHQYYNPVNKELVYGLNDHIVILKNKLWQPGTNELHTFINSIKVNNAEFATDSTAAISLNHFQKNISVDFTAINFNKNPSLNYAYKMEGIDKDWNLLHQLSVANYSNLAPGNYTFMAKAKEQNGAWGPPAILNIRIIPAFWQTWWFLILCIALLFLTAYWLVKRRIKAIRHEAEMKQRIAETEMMALRAQMNPHFIFNCLNSIDNLIQNNEKEKATLYLSKFAKLIRSILETSKNNTVPCWKDMETLKLYVELEELRWDKKISYTINIADEIINGDYKVPPLVIQPFVENAIHHGLLNKTGTDRKLIISVSGAGNHIHYSIEDNGVGRTKAAVYKQLNKPAHESMGMQITTDRINLFNQTSNSSVKITDLYDGQQQPAGTKVEIELINQ